MAFKVKHLSTPHLSTSAIMLFWCYKDTLNADKLQAPRELQVVEEKFWEDLRENGVEHLVFM